MEPIDFVEIARLLNHSRTTAIAVEPVKKSDGAWDLYDGHFRVHTSEFPFQVLYLTSRCTREDQQIAARALDRNTETHVVVPPTLVKRLEVKDSDFKGCNIKGVWTPREYLISFMRQELDAYSSKLRGSAPSYYIDPRIETPSTVARRRPNPLLDLLVSDSRRRGALGILLAEAGQGKTYMSHYLVNRLSTSQSGVIPVLIDSTQWHSLPVAELRDLSKTITHSFRHFGTPIGWAEGHEDQFIRVALKAQLFSIIFDGFDEYILRNQGEVEPFDVLAALREMAEGTGAKIVITSRESFWRTSLADEPREALEKTSTIHLYNILPFETEHARNYFHKRFGLESPLVDRAIELFATLRKQDEHLAGRGFVLRLCADLVEAGAEGSALDLTGTNALPWLIHALCEREALRQQLPLSADEQIDALTDLAVEMSGSQEATTELLEFAVRLAKPELQDADVRATLEKLKSDPLVEFLPDQERWSFKEEQVRVALVAQRLVRWACEGDQTRMERFRLEPGSVGDLAAAFVTLASRESEERFMDAVRVVIRTCQSSSGSSTDGKGRFAGSVVLRAVEKLRPRGADRGDRAQLLHDLFDGDAISSVIWSGSIQSLDLSGISFDGCRFEATMWVNCVFDTKSTFRRCHFVGGRDHGCVGLGGVALDECSMDSEASSWLEAVRIREGRKAYSSEHLRSDLDAVLRKFLTPGGSGLRSVAEKDLDRGPINVSPHKSVVLETVQKRLLEGHHISGVTGGGYHVASHAQDAFKFYGTNNVLSGPLREVFEELKAKLSLQ